MVVGSGMCNSAEKEFRNLRSASLAVGSPCRHPQYLAKADRCVKVHGALLKGVLVKYGDHRTNNTDTVQMPMILWVNSLHQPS